MKKAIFISFIVMMLAVPSSSWSQQEDMEPDHSYKPLTLKLKDDGSKYVRFIMWHQLWLEARSNQKSMRYSIRRSRFLAYAQISPRFLILTHFGLNNLNAGRLTANPNTQTANQASLLFLHDAWAEFALVPKKLHIGSGLHYWNGISRLSNQSTLNMMTLDNPGAGNSDVRLFPWNNITTSDQFARHLGMYAKGTLGKLQYRVSINNSRNNIGQLGGVPSYQVDNADGTGIWNFAGYFKYDFLDQESDKLPYFVGSYLGKKKIFSVGAGFFHHPNALAVNNLNNRESVTHFAMDAFYDAPLSEQVAISALAAYYNYNYGSTSGFNTGGLVPSSGNVIHSQLGVLFRESKLMPYVTYNSANLDFTPNNSNEFGLGLNYFINGHFAKITAEFTTGKRGGVGAESTNIFRLQTHIFL